ncbi:hypothetical protein NQ314_014930 [Rhamnusium bicolor]|uniref:Uncharacterized protein n=1 Tax=Rhamnusium bicolor TaxID=1586634 RepID=A0AAV8X0P3_9CUCU|nr:hypothetical protein NQ314_014930 [Rhamnusium bicolor]
MKVAVVVLMVFAVAIAANQLPENERQSLKRIYDHCQSNSETKVDEDLLRKLSQNTDNQQVGAHMLCVSVGAGLQKQNGQLDKNIIKNKISLVIEDKSRVDDLVTKCAVQKETPEKTAVKMFTCFDQNNVKYYHVNQ